jgi:alanine racemase
LCAADSLFEAAATQEQIKRFQAVVQSIKAAGLAIPRIHAANSAGALSVPGSHFTMARAGCVLYGLHPSLDVPLPAGFRPVLSWKTTVAQVKTIPAGWPVGYGGVYRAPASTRIAMLPVGYGDGLRGRPTPWGDALIGGRRVPVIGRVAMDRCVVSIDEVEDVGVGDEVVLIGRQGREEITAEEAARRLDLSNTELLAGLGERIPRVVAGSGGS